LLCLNLELENYRACRLGHIDLNGKKSGLYRFMIPEKSPNFLFILDGLADCWANILGGGPERTIFRKELGCNDYQYLAFLIGFKLSR